MYLLHVSQTLYVVKIDEEVKSKCVTPNCCDVVCVFLSSNSRRLRLTLNITDVITIIITVILVVELPLLMIMKSIYSVPNDPIL